MQTLTFLKQFNEWRPRKSQFMAEKMTEEALQRRPFRCLHCYQPIKEHGFCSIDCVEHHADMIAEAEATGN